MTHNYIIIVVIRRGIECGGGVLLLYLCHFSARALIVF